MDNVYKGSSIICRKWVWYNVEKGKSGKGIKFWCLFHVIPFLCLSQLHLIQEIRYPFWTLFIFYCIQIVLYPITTTLYHFHHKKTIYTSEKKIKIWCLFHVIPFPRYTKPTLSTFLRYPFSTFFWCLLHVIPFPLLFFDAFSTICLLRQYQLGIGFIYFI